MTPDTLLLDMPAPAPKHPARYTDVLLVPMAAMLRGCTRILDPFGGMGGIFQIGAWLPAAQIEAIEIEPEWAARHPRTTLGSALALPWPNGYFDAICTSPAYANRTADHHSAKDGSQRRTYTHMLGRKLHPDNSGAMQWGDGYRAFHVAAWTEARRVLQSGGVFVLNIKDFYHKWERVHVTAWHVDTLRAMGFEIEQHRQIDTPSMRYGRNGAMRMKYESVIKMRLTA